MGRIFKRVVKRIVYKRAKGGSGELFGAILGISSILAVVMYSILALSDVNNKLTLDNVCRRYTLKVESLGSMTDIEILNMQNSVKQVVVDRFGSLVDPNSIVVTINTAEYGNNVSVELQCGIKLKQNMIVGYLVPGKSIDEVEYTQYDRKYSSTAKN